MVWSPYHLYDVPVWDPVSMCDTRTSTEVTSTRTLYYYLFDHIYDIQHIICSTSTWTVLLLDQHKMREPPHRSIDKKTTRVAAIVGENQEVDLFLVPSSIWEGEHHQSHHVSHQHIHVWFSLTIQGTIDPIQSVLKISTLNWKGSHISWNKKYRDICIELERRSFSPHHRISFSPGLLLRGRRFNWGTDLPCFHQYWTHSESDYQQTPRTHGNTLIPHSRRPHSE